MSSSSLLAAPPFSLKEFTIPYKVTLGAHQTLNNVAVEVDRDTDFYWVALLANYTGLAYSVDFTDATGQQMSNGALQSFAFAAYATGLAPPYVLQAPLFFPAGSAILLNLYELSGAENGPIQLLFRGFKRIPNYS